MAINFPASPSTSDEYTFNGRTWVYDGSAWNLKRTGNVEVGNLTVSTATSTDTLTASGNITASANINVSENAVITGNATVSGTITSTGNVTTSGNLTINGTTQKFHQGSSNYFVRQYILHGQTTNATETEIYIGGVSGSRIPVAENATIFYEANIVARRTDAPNESAGWELQAVVDNFSGTTADVGDVYEIAAARDDSSWLVDVRGDDTNDAIGVWVTGAAGKTIRWTAVVQTMEVIQ